MEPYDIARFLTDEQKQKILSLEWFLDEEGRISAIHDCEDSDLRCCPLGAICGGGSPPAPLLASRLGYEGDDPKCDEFIDAAAAFMKDADTGKITPGNLAAALGVTA